MHVRVDAPQAVNLGGKLIHPPHAVSIHFDGDDHVGGGGDGRRAGRGQRGWAVNHDAVVGVILRHRVPQVTDGPQVGPLPLEQIHVQVAQLVVGRQYVQAPDAAVIQQVVVVGVRYGQQPRQGVVLPRREQRLGGVGLGVCINEQHPLSVLGGQDGGHIDGGDGLSDAALQVYNGDCLHVYCPFSVLKFEALPQDSPPGVHPDGEVAVGAVDVLNMPGTRRGMVFGSLPPISAPKAAGTKV